MITTDPFKILDEQRHFYHNLYRSKFEDKDSKAGEAFLHSLNIPKLSEEQKQSCKGTISLDEIKAILDTFQNNKSPGNDGIPVEFYKICWDLISDSFLECVNEAFTYGEMSSSQKKAIIAIIAKQGKDRTYLENWRHYHYYSNNTNVKFN